MINPPRLTLCTYLSRWTPSKEQLQVNLLVVPIGDPKDPLTQGLAIPPAPPFQGATLEVAAHLGSDPTIVPTRADIPASTSVQLAAPPDQAAIFDAFRNTLDLSLPPEPAVRSGSATLRKHLPLSYRRSFGFTGPRTPLASIDDTYRCAKRCVPSAIPAPPPKDPRLSWGELFAMMLRQPELARAAGLIHTINLDVGTTYQNGGWLFFTLGSGGAFHDQWVADSTFARWFATRVPQLEATPRPVFTSVLFPVAADATAAAAFGPLDEVYPEAIAYDDGFAKIVHASQPRSTDPYDDEDEPEDERFPPPLVDAGIRLGWDDESIVERLDRGLSATGPGGQPLPDAPTGAAGYRVDVRARGTTAWTSLCRISSAGVAIGTTTIPAFENELTVEVHPGQLDGQYWIPPSYTQWRGGSLVTETSAERDVLGESSTDSPDFTPVGVNAVPLRYGQSYDFRVRMADATGGGPAVDETAVNSAEAPVASYAFKRFVPLGGLDVTVPTAAPEGSFELKRSRIGWPQAGYADAPNALTRLAAIAQANKAASIVTRLDLPDPDSRFVELRVMVLHPRLDPLGDDAGFVELYRTARAFPDLDLEGEETGPLSISATWVDCARLSDVTWPDSAAAPGSVTGPLPVPTGRAVRIEARAMAPANASYFGVDSARFGIVSDLTPQPLFRLPSVDDHILREAPDAEQLVSVYLRPDPATDSLSEAKVTRIRPSRVLATRLAGASGLVEDDAVLMDAEGQRTVFACHGLKHAMAPDRSSVLLSAPDELSGQWLNVLRLTIDRDWSWLAYAGASIMVTRQITMVGPGPEVDAMPATNLGTIAIQNTISPRAARGDVDRESFDFCLIDGFIPPLSPPPMRRPYELQVNYTVTLQRADTSSVTHSVTTLLPVTQPPRQVPEVVATGHAFSDYQVLGDYESTGTRERMLWIEFAKPLEDDRDAYFARVLASTTDPMLMPDQLPLQDPPAYDKAPLDPEFVRVVRPGQIQDLSGLGVAQRLIPAKSLDGRPVRHFLLPLPPSLTASSPELFGFFTYEFTVGHDVVDSENPWWSTAQARFGPPLVLEGVQHPAPALPIDLHRNGFLNEYAISSSYARPVQNGVNYMPLVPTTEIWIVAYARLARADGQGWQNVKLAARKATPQRGRPGQGSNVGGAMQALGRWSDADLAAMLKAYGLPEQTDLTFLAVELMPEPNGAFDAPLSGDLGDVRILRTSRLVPASDRCCL